jgi:crossover junction endodeoxyribonuclease RuvC
VLPWRAVIVLGIDPGSRRCGYGVVERAGGRFRALASGVLAPRALTMAERLGLLFDGLSAIVADEAVDEVAVETAYSGRFPRSALVLGQARGVALAAVARAGLPVFEYAPTAVKRAFTGSGRAEKAQMIRAARTLFGAPPRLADEADALAVAVCHLAAARAHVAADRRGGAPRAPRAAELVARLRPAVRRYGVAR